MSEAQKPAAPPRVISLPRTRRLSLAAMATETAHQTVLALWTGGLVFTASLVVPTLLASLEDAEAAARLSLTLLDRIGLLGCGAGGFLLLTTLLMHLLALRAQKTIVGQLLLLVAMTGLATGLQILLAPRLAEMVRTQPRLFEPGAAVAELSRFRTHFGVYLSLLLVQAMMGIALMLGGIRRWYRYLPVRSRETDVFWP